MAERTGTADIGDTGGKAQNWGTEGVPNVLGQFILRLGVRVHTGQRPEASLEVCWGSARD